MSSQCRAPRRAAARPAGPTRTAPVISRRSWPARTDRRTACARAQRPICWSLRETVGSGAYGPRNGPAGRLHADNDVAVRKPGADHRAADHPDIRRMVGQGPLLACGCKRIGGLRRWMVVSGDAGEFAEFYRASKDDCLRAVVASTGDRQAAEDAVAEAFARAWARWRTVRAHPAPAAWVVRTALNANVSWWRQRRREVQLADAWPALAVRQEPDAGAAALAGPAVLAALRRLPARQREVIALRAFLDLDTAGTAAVLGIAPGTDRAHGPGRRRAQGLP